jgi:hypothetical protein
MRALIFFLNLWVFKALYSNDVLVNLQGLWWMCCILFSVWFIWKSCRFIQTIWTEEGTDIVWSDIPEGQIIQVCEILNRRRK